MAEVNVEKLAGDIGTTVDKLLQQLEQAGISKKAGDMVSEAEKSTLLDHLSKQHGGTGSEGPARMTLQRKSKSTLSVTGSTGKAKSVQVEVRKTRTYVKKSAIEQQQEEERLAAEEAARKAAELKAQQEAEELKAKQEAERKAKEEAERKAKEEAKRKAEAERKAFIDFQAIAERTQQSSRPDLISREQTTLAGRLILPFANTPLQMNRLAMREMLDIYKGRYKGSGELTNKLGKIGYYGFVQTIFFAGLQSAAFAIFGNSEDDELKAKKQGQMIDTVVDSGLRGMGIKGAILNGVVNAAKELETQAGKDYGADYSEVAEDLLNISPPIGSKFRKLDAAGNTYKYNKEQIDEEGIEFSLDSPGLEVATQVTEAITNLPANRIFKKANNVKNAMSDEYEPWQRFLMFLGWSNWDVAPEQAKDQAQGKKKKKDKPRKELKDAESIL